MHETLNGLLTQKPGRDPQQGEIKLFTVEHRKGKSGKPYIKIKNATAEMGGQPYRILSAEKTDFVDQHGNISFSVEVEASSSPPSTIQSLRATMQQGEDRNDAIRSQVNEPIEMTPQFTGPPMRQRPINAPQSPVHAQQGEDRTRQWVGGPMSKDDYWRRKEDRDEERQKFIIRQHSQSMALEVLKLKVTLNELTVEDLTPAKLKQLADYFDRDVLGATNGN